MYKIGNDIVKKVFVGDSAIKAIYYGISPIFLNIVDTITGVEYTDWEYNDPIRTRTTTPYTQYKYADGSLSEKIYGDPSEETQEAVSTVEYGEWEYNITVSSGTRERTVTNKYTYNQDDPPTVRTSSASSEEETGTRSAGTTYTYDWKNSQRTNVITYTFTDATKTIDNVESGTVTYDFNIIVTTNDSNESITQIPASGGIFKAVTSGNINRLWNGSPVSGQEATASVESITTTGSWITNGSLGLFTVVSRGTTVGDALQGTVKATTTVDTKEIESNTVSLTLQANAIESTSTGELTFSGTTRVNSSQGTYPYSVTATNTITYTSGSTETEEVTPTINASSSDSFVTLSNNNMVVAGNTDYSDRTATITFSANTPDYSPINVTVTQNKYFLWKLNVKNINTTNLTLYFKQEVAEGDSQEEWLSNVTGVNLGTITINSKNSVGGTNPSVTINATGVNDTEQVYSYSESIPSLGSPVEMSFNIENPVATVIRSSTPEDIYHLDYTNLPSTISLDAE